MSWDEFQAELRGVGELEAVRTAHQTYLKKMVFRGLLNSKAKPVMDVISEIFSVVLRFQAQLRSGAEFWHKPAVLTSLAATHRKFRECTVFLAAVAGKLASTGYQPHLDDFLLRLDFNGFYSKFTRR